MPPHLQTISLEHLPESHSIHIALYRNLRNAAFLHQQLLAGNTDFEYALVDASVVISKLHILAAVYRACNDALAGRLKSRNIHSEVVFSLSPNNNIAESFRRFGITPTTASLLVIRIAPASAADSIAEHLGSVVEGDAVDFSDEELSALVDTKRVRKVYKLTGTSGGGGGGGGGGRGGKKGVGINGGVEKVISEEDERRELSIAVLGMMALRGATN
ncbi:hypothetical protein ACMFMG_000291 [Clarireedia jacksonii]